MAEQMSEQEMKNLVGRYQQYQYQAEGLMQQINIARSSIAELDKAIHTIEELEKTDAQKDTLVPIGAGSYVHASLAKPDTVLLGVGAGVSLEKSSAEAKALLSKRKDELAKLVESMSGSVEKLGKEMETLQAVFQKYAAQEQKAAASQIPQAY